LAGLQQTNQRAELRAATRAVNRGAEEVRTDSQYVVDGHARLGRGERAVARDGSDNGDLWVHFEEALRRRGGPSSVLFTKALGHAKARDVLEGRTTREDKAGNEAADRLAVDAALSHAAPEAVVADLKQRLERAREVQLMMLDVSAAELATARPPHGPGAPPRPGDAATGNPPGETTATTPYPWGWAPEGPQEQVELPELATPSRWHGPSFAWGPRLWG